jgi:hypothetical protein
VSGLFTGAWIARPLHWANTLSTCDTHLQQYVKMRGILQIKEENGCRRSDTDETTLPLPPGALLAPRVVKKTVPPTGLALLPQAICCFGGRRIPIAIPLPQTHLQTDPQTRQLRSCLATQQSHQPETGRRFDGRRHHRPWRVFFILPPRGSAHPQTRLCLRHGAVIW